MEEHRINLDKPRLAGGLVGLVLIAGLVAVLASGRVDGSMVIIAGLASLVMAGWCGWMIWARGVAFCPECGMRITGLFMKDNSARQCKGCGGYVESKAGRLIMASDEALAEFPTFRAGCPPTIEWPPGCCVCGAPATRAVDVQLKERQDGPLAGDVAVRAATLGTMKLSQESTHVVQVPHCQQHQNGAELVRASDEDGAGLDLLFRSNAYCQAFRKLNQHKA